MWKRLHRVLWLAYNIVVGAGKEIKGELLVKN
jgi:hypothetical protein